MWRRSNYFCVNKLFDSTIISFLFYMSSVPYVLFEDTEKVGTIIQLNLADTNIYHYLY